MAEDMRSKIVVLFMGMQSNDATSKEKKAGETFFQIQKSQKAKHKEGPFMDAVAKLYNELPGKPERHDFFVNLFNKEEPEILDIIGTVNHNPIAEKSRATFEELDQMAGKVGDFLNDLLGPEKKSGRRK